MQDDRSDFRLGEGEEGVALPPSSHPSLPFMSLSEVAWHSPSPCPRDVAFCTPESCGDPGG